MKNQIKYRHHVITGESLLDALCIEHLSELPRRTHKENQFTLQHSQPILVCYLM